MSHHAHAHHHHGLRYLAIALATAGLAILAILAYGELRPQQVQGSPPDPNTGHKVSICHATSSATNPFTYNTVDVVAGGLRGGHHNHEGDIIPPFTWYDKDGVEYAFAGMNLGTIYDGATGAELLENGCEVPDEPPGPTDVCPNLDGVQSEVPAGYHKNDAGNCVTDEPPPTDVCPNIEGNQSEVPAGYVIDDAGDCVEPDEPPGPTDKCPNIDGMQADVPEGYYVDASGNCVKPDDPTDVCPNIEGDQSEVPDGYYVNDDGDCVKPDEPPAGEDVCPNIEGDQAEVPDGLELRDGACVEPEGGENGGGGNGGTTDTKGESAGPTKVKTGGHKVRELPFTGAEQTTLTLLGAAMLGLGLVLEFTHRRRVATT